MNRRGFLMAVAGVGTTAAFSRNLPFSGHTVAQGYRPDGWGDVTFSRVEIRISRHLTERAAENERRRILKAPVNEFLGEFYPGDPEEQELSGDLASIGQVVHHDVLAGVAAARSTLLMGTFRVGPLMWMIDARNAPLDLVTELASQIAEVIHGGGVDRYRTTASLRLLLPEPDDFSVEAAFADVEDFMFRFGL